MFTALPTQRGLDLAATTLPVSRMELSARTVAWPADRLDAPRWAGCPGDLAAGPDAARRVRVALRALPGRGDRLVNGRAVAAELVKRRPRPPVVALAEDMMTTTEAAKRLGMGHRAALDWLRHRGIRPLGRQGGRSGENVYPTVQIMGYLHKIAAAYGELLATVEPAAAARPQLNWVPCPPCCATIPGIRADDR